MLGAYPGVYTKCRAFTLCKQGLKMAINTGKLAGNPKDIVRIHRQSHVYGGSPTVLKYLRLVETKFRNCLNFTLSNKYKCNRGIWQWLTDQSYYSKKKRRLSWQLFKVMALVRVYGYHRGRALLRIPIYELESRATNKKPHSLWQTQGVHL